MRLRVIFALLSIALCIFDESSAFAYPSLVSSGLLANYDIGNAASFSGGTVSTINDLQGTYNLTKNGAVTSETTTNGKALVFSGAGSLLMSASMWSSFSSPYADSIFMWIYPTGDGVVLDEMSNNGIWHDSQIEVSGTQLKFRQWDMASPYETATISLNNWYYVGFTYDGTKLVSYVNGKQVGSVTYARSYSNQSTLVYHVGQADGTTMGASGYGNFKFAGMQIYNRALSTAEIQTNYLATQTRIGLSAPTGVQATSSLATQGTTSFNSVASASSYVVNVFDSATSTFIESATVTPSGTTFSGLSPNTNYYLTVYAVGDGSATFNSPESTPVYFKTPKYVTTLTVTFGSGTSAAKKNTTSKLTATFNTPGTVTFYYNNRVINKCANLFSNSGSVDCNWKPITHGQTAISASISPTDSTNYSPAISPTFNVVTGKRTSAR